MVSHQVRLIQIFKRLSILYPKVTLVNISNHFQPADNDIENGIIFDYYIYINTRLSRHSLNRSATDMLNTYNQVTDSIYNF
mgnify:CR=1 FL=1